METQVNQSNPLIDSQSQFSMRIFILNLLLVAVGLVLGISFVDPKESFTLKCQQFVPAEYQIVTWTQIKNQEVAEIQEGYVRSVFFGDKDVAKLPCPKIFLNNSQSQIMEQRKDQAIRPNCFNVLVCEYKIASNDFNIFIQTSDLKRWKVPSIPKTVSKIMVLGDSGSKEKFENCTNGSCKREYAIWPIQEHAVKQKFDLIFHMGDFRYTDVVCNKDKCEDNLQNWIVEFFGPLYKLFQKAPVVFIRGNHEMCDPKEAGIGWFHFVYHRRSVNSPHCDQVKQDDWKYTPNWKFTFSGQQFVVMDTSFANDYPSKDSSKYKEIIKDLYDLVGNRHTILLTHKPIWSCKGETVDEKILNWTLQKALDNTLPPSIKLMIAGHVHAYVMIGHKTKAPQLMVGNSGVQLNADWNIPNNGEVRIASETFKIVPTAEFGYVMLTRQANNAIGWNITSWFVKIQPDRVTWKSQPQEFAIPR
jgi:predicted phosphodiesterase